MPPSNCGVHCFFLLVSSLSTSEVRFFFTIFVYIFETKVRVAMEVLQMMQVIKNLFTHKLRNSRLVQI